MVHFFECGGYTLNSDFDSGNLGCAELVKKYTDEIFNPGVDPLTSDHHHHGHASVNAEINVWTRPDCEGTQYENGNRTWFFFSVRGGKPSHILRLNVMNLNRQAKLYSQGMHPVIRIGASGKWERSKDRPSYRSDDENFVMSFVHRAGEDPSVEHFYAFTFPYTYRELQEYFGRLDRRFRKRMFEVQKRSQEQNVTLFVDQADLEGMTENANTTMTTADGTASPPSLSQLLLRRESSFDTNPDLTTVEDLYNEIYYCRELLTYSVEQRRIDLVTITSYHGIMADREERIPDLFPEGLRHRCHKFRNKKIVFISSRVHPGETPASFVLNGFIKLLLDRKSQIASALRRMYVFKIVPFLNPDGVCNGMYRSDTLGHNLNRVYTSPDLKRHPSIYAVRKLLRFYQFGLDSESNPIAIPEDVVITDNNEVDTSPETMTPPELSSSSSSTNQVISLKEMIMNKLNREHNQVGDDDITNNLILSSPIEVTVDACSENDENCTPRPLGSLESGIESESTESRSECSARTPLGSGKTSVARSRKTSGSKEVKVKSSIITTRPKSKKEFKRKASPKATIMSARYKSGAEDSKAVETMVGHLASGIDFHNLYQHFESELTPDKVDDKTNLFVYIDLHGHASKKGVFMYGNHMSHPMQAVECMLLPRLMSMNSHHFHFDACNFSERNMYHKGKKDGLSKEGSGRVAVYKSTGLIKCYTLECNYNTGKYVNVLPGRGKDKSPRPVNLVPPKYTPTHFEEVGRALGASILDLTNSNPISRLVNSEYRTLQGLRNALRMEIEKTFTKNQVLLKTAKGKLKRLRTAMGIQSAKEGPSSSSDVTTFKENHSSLWSVPMNRAISLKTPSLNTSNRGALISARIRDPGSSSSSSQGNSAVGGGSGTLYGKKERAGTRKKLLVDPSKVKKDSNPVIPLLNLVPVKRLKGSGTSGTGLLIPDDLLSVPSTSTSSDEMSRTPSSSSSSNSSTALQSSEEAVLTTVHQTKVINKRLSGIPVFKRPTPLVTIASTLDRQSSTAYSVAALPSTSKGVGLVKSTKISTAAGSGIRVTSGMAGKRLNAEPGSTGSVGGSSVVKLKNKRSLKSDALTVKRKKSRAKSVWH